MENKEFGTPPWEKYLKDAEPLPNKETDLNWRHVNIDDMEVKAVELPTGHIRTQINENGDVLGITWGINRHTHQPIMVGRFGKGAEGQPNISDPVYKTLFKVALKMGLEKKDSQKKDLSEAEGYERGNPDNFEKE